MNNLGVIANVPNPIKVRLIRPSSREKDNLLVKNLEDLRQAGFAIIEDDHASDANWPFSSGTIENRLQEFTSALMDPDCRIILSARGGYGASDLLPNLPWKDLKKIEEKLIIGFSDVSAIHAAFYHHLGWRGLHGLMPSNSYWGQNGFSADKDAMMDIMRHPTQAGGSLSIQRVFENGNLSTSPSTVSGKLFGGCFSVLTNLIGTPYFPRDLQGHLIFWEDIGENPGRLMRFLNQWIQSGSLKGVAGIVLGRFVDCDDEVGTQMGRIPKSISLRTGLPVFESSDFGHCSPNFPLMVGADARVTQTNFRWQSKEIIA